MAPTEIVRHRLFNQHIGGTRFHSPEEIVTWLGAVQAQDYNGGLWGIGLRLPGITAGEVEEAIAGRKILRTWPMRGTLHFVPARDARWMLALLTPRVIRRYAARYRELHLTEQEFEQSAQLLVDALHGGGQLTRAQVFSVLKEGGVSVDGQRGIHILGNLAQKGIICFGNRVGKQHTFVLLDEWVPAGEQLGREEALEEITRRYFRSHGPATVQDFTWWSGLAAADARRGMERAGADIVREDQEGHTYWMSLHPPAVRSVPDAALLPPYDEYLIGYRDRSAAMDPTDLKKFDPRTISAPFIIHGHVAGVWRRIPRREGLAVHTTAFRLLSGQEKDSLSMAVNRYSTFLGLQLIEHRHDSK